MASSRVGLRIRTFIVLVRGTATRASITGIENARVLPVPVCAVATTSRPSMSGGMACAWTGVGVTNSFLSRLFRNAEQRLSSEKCCIHCVRFSLRRTGTLSVFRIAALGNTRASKRGVRRVCRIECALQKLSGCGVGPAQNHCYWNPADYREYLAKAFDRNEKAHQIVTQSENIPLDWHYR